MLMGWPTNSFFFSQKICSSIVVVVALTAGHIKSRPVEQQPINIYYRVSVCTIKIDSIIDKAKTPDIAVINYALLCATMDHFFVLLN